MNAERVNAGITICSGQSGVDYHLKPVGKTTRGKGKLETYNWEKRDSTSRLDSECKCQRRDLGKDRSSKRKTQKVHLRWMRRPRRRDEYPRRQKAEEKGRAMRPQTKLNGRGLKGKWSPGTVPHKENHLVSCKSRGRRPQGGWGTLMKGREEKCHRYIHQHTGWEKEERKKGWSPGGAV